MRIYRSFVFLAFALAFAGSGFQCGKECYSTRVGYEPAVMTAAHLDYSGSKPLTVSNSAPRHDYGLRLMVSAAVYDSLLGNGQPGCPTYENLAPALALEVKSVLPFANGVPAGADVTDRFHFVPPGACCPNEHEPALAGAPFATQELKKDPRDTVAVDLYLAQPPVQNGPQQFEVTLLLSGQKKLTVQTDIIDLQ